MRALRSRAPVGGGLADDPDVRHHPERQRSSTKTPNRRTRCQAKLRFERLCAAARSPVKGSPDSAGLDIASCESVSIPPRGSLGVDTGLAMRFPEGTYGQIFGRSGLAVSNVNVAGGVIDPDYTGSVRVVLMNHSEDPLEIAVGQRIAQLVVLPLVRVEPEECKSSVARRTSRRGSKGFGSSGYFDVQM